MRRCIYINDSDLTLDLYCDNRISNRKYTLLNFLPKNLWEQFSRFMNKYFLLIACLQLWPLITPVNPASTWGPLIFIFAVSATKEAWDDYNRYLSDKQANEKEVWVVKQGTRTRVQAQNIRVGNIVWLRENDEVPCDLVLIGTSDPQGVCFVETAALDGETDLKTRVIPSACAGITSELLHRIKGVIECPYPDKDIRRFDANIRLFPPFIENDLCPLTINNTLLQSCYLRNTEWACGVAVYTGNETKLGMSRGIPEPKLTAVDAMIDKLTGAIFLFQLVVVIVLGIAGNVWKDTEARKVSLDLVKSLYAKFIDWDEEMYDPDSGTHAHATNTGISEDLGQVEYILTDKTGTLTENKMIFRRCCINGVYYGNETGDALKDVELLRAVGCNCPEVIKFLTIMAVCNTVVPLKSKNGEVCYKAQSQDEEALVLAAGRLHMVLVDKTGNMLQVKFNALTLQYEILDTLEFTSDRKRMSVVVKDCQSGKIILLLKGADEAILPCACSGQQIRTFVEAVEQYSQLGLRTLCLAWRELTQDEYHEWSLLFKEASGTLVDREWKIAEVCQRLERDLEILGITAIEDRLQPKGQLLLIHGKTEEEVSRSLERVLLTMRITTSEPKDVAFVVDGWALEMTLKHHREAFTQLALLSRTAICCRVTPSQKAQLVELLKRCDYRTLAIGDGGNDVRMIQMADIGVGISGREGQQAARAADYSIGKFRFLKRLILVHGRYSYNRTAFLSQYSFYKSLLVCFIQIFFSFISGVSGTSLFNSVSLMAYNVFYTSIPVLMNVLDKDLHEKTVMQHAQILYYCQAGRLLNPSTFAGWFGRSLFHALVVFIVTIHVYSDERSEMEELSMVALSGCIWLQAFVVTLETNSFTLLQHLAIWGNLVAFYIINFLVSTIPWAGMYTVMFRICGQPAYWVTMMLLVIVGMAPVLALKYFRYTYRSSTINILQQAERLRAPYLPLGNMESQSRTTEKEVIPMSITLPKSRNSVYEPLLSDSPSAIRRASGVSASFDVFNASPSRLSSTYSRNYKSN
ncbi:hypothetical protein AMTRI_Chr02g217130 [Amborella trichopoda]